MSGIAVIGMACRFPGARTVNDFWRNLREGVESITPIPDAMLREAGVPPELLRHPQYVKAAALLDDIDRFDAGFFALSPREAEILDVQHRLVLECAWEALEDACCVPERFAGSIGVYAGAGMNAYLLANLLPQRELLTSAGEFQALISNDKDYLPTRVSYKLNLRGPSVSVQTACSTSLVAIHMACQSLLGGECDVALAGGVSVRVPQHAGYLYQEGMILSRDGHCRAFDAAASGTVPGSGVGVVVLKRLDDARADGDRIDAVVLGSAINNDGALKVGYTAPGVDGQRAVIREAIALAGVSPAGIDYVEAHGTGTPLGDPVEFAALSQAMPRDGGPPCTLGAVKTNVGHLDTAAGVAGFIKTVLALKHAEIPPTLHFERSNPQIDLAGRGFRINTRAEAWPQHGHPRRAGVSSFGIGGTNAHVVLEEAPARPGRAQRGRRDGQPAEELDGDITGRSPLADSRSVDMPQLLVVSARSEGALAASLQALARSLADSEHDLADVAWSLQTGRHAFTRRAGLVARDRQTAADVLRAFDAGSGEGRLKPAPTSAHAIARDVARPRSTVFLFPGQGSQFPGMARELYEWLPIFRQEVDAGCEIVRPFVNRDLRELLLANDHARAAALRQTAVAQPSIFIVEYALACQLRAWGIEPARMVGHSVGEYTAACIAGTFERADALMLLAERGRLMQQCAPGRMVAIRLEADRLRGMTAGTVAIAAINAPDLCVASGPAEDIAALERECAARQITCQPLETSHAFHSSMMDGVLDEFGQRVAGVRLSAPGVPWASNVTGDWITAAQASDPEYWVRHLRATVQFSAGIEAALALHDAVLLEVGPGRALTILADEHLHGRDVPVVACMRHPRDPGSDHETLLRAVGRAWAAGVDVRWEALGGERPRVRVALPTYPFERQRYWIDPPTFAEATAGKPAGVTAALDKVDPPRDIDPITGDERRPIDAWFMVPSWIASPRPDVSADRASAQWLVFGDDDDELLAQVIEKLRAGGARVTVAVAGDGCREVESQRYVVRAPVPEDYVVLLERVAPRHVLFAWRQGEEAFFSLLWLARALADRAADRASIDVLTCGMAPVGGEEPIDASAALLLGPLQVIPRELPHIRCRGIDCPPASGSRDVLAALVYAEIVAEPNDPLVAYRQNQRRVRTLAPVRLPERPVRFEPGGHYLVTGGLGGVGLVLASHVADLGHADLGDADRGGVTLTLLARSPAGPPALERIRALEATGTRVRTVAADVADIDALRHALRNAEAESGPIRGVIHAAGVAGGRLLQRLTREDAAAVLRPKVTGALHLARLFERRDLDFLVFVSSLTGVVGETGQVDYAAANAFLDALAHRLRAAGMPACSIDWDTWRESGMAVAGRLSGVLEEARAARVRLGLSNAEAIQVFDRVLASGLAQVVVSTRDMAVRSQEEAAAAEAMRRAVAAPARHERPPLTVPFAAATTVQEQALCRIWGVLLGIDGIGVHDDFFELGGHSLLATQVLSRVRQQLGVSLSLQQFFDDPTIARLALAVEAAQLELVLAEVDRLTDEDAVRAIHPPS